ncbi:SgcJ/EcaC family oxidoreductase [Brevibacterium sp. S111]|uniref:SgcJ/EcaC family oxidoreductase n=1 Tax=Brevibacterium sp. S111 TaxID=2483795 RepID=UPI001081FBC3|nr:SgcJ/EcaC family oxidoreductase [Brevibacterium sp. S111]TGD12951.1 SgcJ/EcaC family oxidoreductase [Brevibacterium sp. S111]
MTDQIEQLVADAVEVQADVDALMALHTADTVIVNVAGRRLLGRESFREAMAAAMATPLADVRTDVEIDDVTRPGPDVAIVSCTKRIYASGSDSPESEAFLTYVVVDEGGQWRIALAQTTPQANG